MCLIAVDDQNEYVSLLANMMLNYVRNGSLGIDYALKTSQISNIISRLETSYQDTEFNLCPKNIAFLECGAHQINTNTSETIFKFTDGNCLGSLEERMVKYGLSSAANVSCISV